MMENQKIDAHTHFSLSREDRRPSPWDPLDNYQADSVEMVEHLKSQGVFKTVSLTHYAGKNCDIDAAVKMAQMHPDFFHFSCNFSENDAPEAVFDLMAQYKEMGAVSVGELAINQWICLLYTSPSPRD